MVIFHSYVKLPEGNVWVCPITNHVWVWNLSNITTWGHGQQLKNTRRLPWNFRSECWLNIWIHYGEIYGHLGIKELAGMEHDAKNVTVSPFFHLWLSLSRFGSPAMKRSNGIWEQKAWRPELKPFTVSEMDFFHHRELTWFTIWVVPFTPSGWFIMENPSINRWFGGTSILGNLHMYPFVI